MFFILGVSIAIFLELLLVVKKKKTNADRILVLWLFLLIVQQLIHYFIYSGEIYSFPHWLGVQFPIPILYGVLLYFYVNEITGNKIKNNWVKFLHVVPALSSIIVAIPFYILSGDDKIYVYQHEAVGFEWYVIYQKVLVVVFGLMYSIWSLRIINKHQIKIEELFSNTDKKELQWLRYLSIGFGIIWIIVLFFDNNIIYSAVAILVLFIGFFGINQLNIFYTIIEQDNLIDEKIVISKAKNQNADLGLKQKVIAGKYAKSGLNEEMAAQIYSQLNEFMADASVYKNESLTLTELSKLFNIHPNHLSQVINEREGKNFYNYINALRINEFIKIASLPENKKYTMISLAYDCGFGTKSTFNKHFKANTGKTPTAFFSD